MSELARSAWKGLGILGVVNTLAIAALLTWLLVSDRMDAGRFSRLRTELATTLTEERLRRETEAATAAEAGRRQVELAHLGQMPRTPAERVEEVDRAQDLRTLERRHLAEEARQLGIVLDERRLAIDQERARLSASQAEWQSARDAEAAIGRDAQMKKAVQLLEGAPPRQAREWIVELCTTGRREEAVRYLNAMNRMAASRVLREMKSAEEAVLAADLIEAMRQWTPRVADGPAANAPSSPAP